MFRVLFFASLVFVHGVQAFTISTHKIIQNFLQVNPDTLQEKFSEHYSDCIRYRTEIMKIERCKEYIYHCRLIHHFLTSIAVDITAQRLLPISDNHRYPTIAYYWQQIRFESVFNWYAFYFDCVSRLFIVKLHELSLEKDKDCRALMQREVSDFYTELTLIYKMLCGSTFETRYAQHLTRYFDLITFEQKHVVCA